MTLSPQSFEVTASTLEEALRQILETIYDGAELPDNSAALFRDIVMLLKGNREFTLGPAGMFITAGGQAYPYVLGFALPEQAPTITINNDSIVVEGMKVWQKP